MKKYYTMEMSTDFAIRKGVIQIIEQYGGNYKVNVQGERVTYFFEEDRCRTSVNNMLTSFGVPHTIIQGMMRYPK